MRYNSNRLNKMKDNIKLYKENNELTIKNNLDTIKFSDKIDWAYQHPNNSNTYQTYLHCLNLVEDFITIAMERKDNSLYLEARNLIMDWYENGQDKGSHSWAEHSVSYRIHNIIKFQESNNKYKLKKNVFEKLIKSHCNYLSNEDNYKMNNHGLMMDNALLKASSHIENEEIKKLYIDKALYRIRFALFRDISRKGVHLENSPEYQRVLLAIYRGIRRTLKEINIDIGKDVSLLLDNAQKYRNYILKPNNEYPMLGDTGQIKEENLKKKFEDFIDKEAGIAILQYKNKTEPQKSTFFTFNCGYQRITHKHKDDLSVTFYLEGNDILIDSGKYSYDKTDNIRKFIVSPNGHSTVGIKNEEYTFNNPYTDQFSLYINKFYTGKGYKMVSGLNNLYKRCVIVRSNILTEEGVLFIVDRISSQIEIDLYQNFNINEKADITQASKLKYNININDKDYTLESYNLRSNHIIGDIDKGYISKQFGKAINNKRLTISTSAKRAIFVTAVYNSTNSVDDVSFANNILNFKVNEKKYTVQT